MLWGLWCSPVWPDRQEAENAMWPTRGPTENNTTGLEGLHLVVQPQFLTHFYFYSHHLPFTTLPFVKTIRAILRNCRVCCKRSWAAYSSHGLVVQPLRRVQLLCNPMNCSPQTPLSMGFPKQEYWSGLPCPPPGGINPTQAWNPGLLRWEVGSLPLSHQEAHGSHSESESRSVLSSCLWSHGAVHGILQARILEWVAFPFSRDLPNPGVEPGSPTLQVDSFSTELSGKLGVVRWV